jgi:hypothetical protein
VLFTGFGLYGPYTGQMRAALQQMAPGVPAIDLFADAPVGNPEASAYLLAAYAEWFPEGTVFLCVVDPGVGRDAPAHYILRPTAGGLSAPATACSNWSGAVPERHAAGNDKLKFGWLLDRKRAARPLAVRLPTSHMTCEPGGSASMTPWRPS